VTQVRVHNATGSELASVRVFAPGVPPRPVAFGPLDAGARSDYQDVPDARRIAHIEATGPAGDLVLQPYDLVGEEPLPPGRYTYRLSVTHGRLRLDVREDPPDDG